MALARECGMSDGMVKSVVPRTNWSHAGAFRVRLCVACALVAPFFGFASPAQAQGKVVTISEVTIVGRIQKPIAAVDVSRIQPKMTLAELRQPFLDRIEKAVYLAPF
jgi:hypothetical protein